MASVQVRRSGDRAQTQTNWLVSRHSFAFGPHYDPANTHFGPLIAHNEDVIAPGAGYDNHAHRNTEILTWVLAGSLEHEDSAGHSGVIGPGQLQRASAGSGIRHTERNASTTDEVHLIQMWLRPDVLDAAPDYQQLEVAGRLDDGGLVTVASGTGAPGTLSLRQRDAELSVARLLDGATVNLPESGRRQLFVARGSVQQVAGEQWTLLAGDAARLTGSVGPVLVTAVSEAAEVLLWQFGPDA